MTCPSCGRAELEVFYTQERVPAHSCLLLADRDEAVGFPSGSLRLGWCGTCGFVGNVDLDPSLQAYSTTYEETQGFSPRFRRFAESLADDLIQRHDLRDQDILEIGCGKGEFLALMCERGGNRGIGLDPAYVPGRLEVPAGVEVEFRQELWAPEHGELVGDVVVCRHTLEHISDVATFVGSIRAAIDDRRTLVVFEVPDVLRVLREGAFWDIYYEHCSYFSTTGLTGLFQRCGFEVLDVRLDFDDQYIVLEARPASLRTGGISAVDEEAAAEVGSAVQHFERSFTRALEHWRATVSAVAGRGGRVVIWGAGSKGVAFLTSLGVGDQVEFAVDINPFKRGMHMAGTGHAIRAPEDLVDSPPDLVVAMNPIYLDEIRSTLADLGLHPALQAL
jgi:SAM-dependent methyltransferase